MICYFGMWGCIWGDGFHEIIVPSMELTYPPDKAYLKMIFLFPRWVGYVNPLEGIFLEKSAHTAWYNLTCCNYLHLYPELTNIAPPLGMFWKMILL